MSNFDQIKQLREKTGAGMMDCKKALEEADNDMDKALEALRKKGIKKANKKAERETKEGRIAIAKDSGKAAAVVLACETDFVARNEDFIKVVDEMANKLFELGEEEFKNWAEDKIKNELVVKIGENIQLGEFGIMEGEIVGEYLHSDNKNAALVVLSGGSEQLAKDIAMQVVAMAPEYLSPADVPQETVEKEKEVYRQQMADQNKPAEVIEKIIDGKLNKFYSETCLLKQPFIKDEEKTVEGILGGAKIERFARYSV